MNVSHGGKNVPIMHPTTLKVISNFDPILELGETQYMNWPTTSKLLPGMGPFYLDDATKEALQRDHPKPLQEKSAKELREELEAKGVVVALDAKTKRVLQPIAEENGIGIHKEPKL